MKFMEELGVEDREGTHARWVRYVNEYEEGATVYDGFDRVFEEVRKRGVMQAVVSSKARAQYHIDIVAAGIDRYMSAAVLADDVSSHKPDPESLLVCLEQLGVAATDAIYIGDAASDAEAARNAGMDFGYAAWGDLTHTEPANTAWVLEQPIDILDAVG